MKTRIALVTALSALLLAVLACGPGTPTSGPLPPSATPPAPTRTQSPAAEASPTEEPTQAEPTWPATPSVPQAAATPSLHVGASVTLDEIRMTSLSTGWGLSGPYVLVTADGGLTWREVTPPADTSSGIPDKAYGAFLDAQTAWVLFSSGGQIAYQAQVWQTTDGGATWTPSAPLLHQAYGDTTWAQFAVLDAEHVWLMVLGVYVGAGTHYANQFLRSTDGGLTWTAPFDGDVNWAYSGMVFTDVDHGWLTWETTGAYYQDAPHYASTSDGGLTWDDRELPPPSDGPDIFNTYDYCEPYQPTPLSGRSIRMLMGCFDYYDPPHESASYLYTSPDGGATWQTLLLPASVQASKATLLYFDAAHALLLGREIYRSTDGGATWQHQSSVNWDGRFSFIDPQHGWAVVHMQDQAGLVRTTDGGAHWSLLEPAIGE